MSLDQRHRAIVAWIRDHGQLDVDEFAVTCDVGPDVIRANLANLVRLGIVRRSAGGELALGEQWQDTGPMSAEKERIAKAALAEVPDEGAILLDMSSTVDRLATILPADRELTIVTNSMCLALSLSAQPNFTLMLVGGRIRPSSLSPVDSWAVQALAETYVDVAFLGTTGLTVDHGLTTPDTAEAVVKRAAIVCARRTVVLADHTKIGRHYPAHFADLPDIDTVITDTGLDPVRGAEIEAVGARVVAV